MRVIHYPRVSSLKQANQGDSVDSQGIKLSEDSKARDDEVFKIFTDAGKSASLSDDKIKIWHDKKGYVWAKIDVKKRKGLREILGLLGSSEWDALKVTKWDRFSRNIIFSQLMIAYFKENSKEIVAVDDSNDSLVRDILSVLSQKEIEKLKDRVKDVRVMRFEKGMFPAKSVYGYAPVKKNGKIVGFKEHSKHSKIVKDIFKMALEGCSYKEICKKHKLHPQQYYNIIRNNAYIGLVEFEGRSRKGTHPVLVSEDIFKKVNGL